MTLGYQGFAFGENWPSLAAVLHGRATENADDIAYTFLADGATDATSLTWSALDRRARALGALLCADNARGHPVLLALPSGLGFVESLFACWYAGAIAVPVSLPRHARLRSRLDAIVHDSGAQFAIGSIQERQLLQADPGDDTPTARLRWIDPAAVLADPDPAQWPPSAPVATRIALLQYTSGSTGAPRGVVVTHANLMHNSGLIAEACGHQRGEVIAGWLPLFHDMGLIGLIVQAVVAGARCVLMPPERFLMRPYLWLRMISDYRVCSSPAPNFAYDLCTERITVEQKTALDLSTWRNALNGSEPVRSGTIERFAAAFAACGFRRNAFFPCYGLAESTLLATGPGPERLIVRRSASGALLDDSEPHGHVGCGRPYGDTRMVIVDPVTRTEVLPGRIGEIWLAGASIADGYWNQPPITRETFGGERAGGDAASWLRTGDLGFFAEGQLFITARLRELIIIAGRNHVPIDIERTVECTDAAVVAAIAFSSEIEGRERLVVAAEIRKGRSSDSGDGESLRHHIRAAVAADHDVTPYDIALLRPGAIPRTSSGKVRRHAARDAYLDGTLQRLESSNHVVSAT
jgi:acyl-CoA synthetase (AMP-forming)/AMP-acid ligase II